MSIKNLTIKKGKVVIGGFSEVATVTSISEVANLAPEHKNIIKKLIITGTSFSSEDLVAIKTIGADDGELPNLVSIELKNMAEVPEELFWINNSGLKSNYWLKSFSAPEAVTIKYTCLRNCVVLEEITLESAITIVNEAFMYCSSLTKITLQEATTIGNDAFNCCYALAEINLPKATNIGERAFDGCDALRKLILGGTNITVGSDVFGNNTGQVDLYLSEEEYNTVTGANHNEWENKTWKSITKIVK